MRRGSWWDSHRDAVWSAGLGFAVTTAALVLSILG